MSNPNNLPAQIVVTYGQTYEVDEAMLNDISECHDKDVSNITIEDVMEWLEDWVSEDFPNAESANLTYQDNKGKVIQWNTKS